jgi:glucose/arabinose dehydrogenase
MALAVFAVFAQVGLGACSFGGTAAKPTPKPSPSAPRPSPAASPAFTGAPGCPAPVVGSPAGNLPAAFATALAFGPDGRLFWAERAGTVKVWQGAAAQVFATVSTVTTEPGGGYSERGLLGLAVSPTFAKDHFVYAFYSEPDYAHQTVVRWLDCGGKGTNPTTVVANLPSGTDCCHKGGRIGFGSDGMLYVTLGDNHAAAAAQNNCDVRGKLLRYRPDGGVPAGNLCGPVYAMGLRNPFGIAFAPGGEIYVTNNGPSGDAGGPATGYDTLYQVTAGGNYQWPACYGYSHPIGGAACPGTGPLWSSEATTVVPTGAVVVSAAGPGGYAGHLVFCTFDAGARIYLGPQNVTGGFEACRLDIKESPEHILYYSDTSTIYRFAG